MINAGFGRLNESELLLVDYELGAHRRLGRRPIRALVDRPHVPAVSSGSSAWGRPPAANDREARVGVPRRALGRCACCPRTVGSRMPLHLGDLTQMNVFPGTAVAWTGAAFAGVVEGPAELAGSAALVAAGSGLVTVATDGETAAATDCVCCPSAVSSFTANEQREQHPERNDPGGGSTRPSRRRRRGGASSGTGSTLLGRCSTTAGSTTAGSTAAGSATAGSATAIGRRGSGSRSRAARASSGSTSASSGLMGPSSDATCRTGTRSAILITQRDHGTVGRNLIGRRHANDGPHRGHTSPVRPSA